MKLHDKLRNITVAAAVASAMTLGAGTALAQPFGGPHGPGHHGPGAPDQMIGQLIERAKAQLALNTSQQAMFDTAVASSKAGHQSGQAIHQKVKDTLTAELAKPEPDLAAVAAAADVATDQARTQRKAVRAEWLALYATFTPDQKAVVKDRLQKHLARAESFREKMREHFRSLRGVTG